MERKVFITNKYKSSGFFNYGSQEVAPLFSAAIATISLTCLTTSSEIITAAFKEISNICEACFEISRSVHQTLTAVTTTEQTIGTVSSPSSKASSTFSFRV